MRVRFELEYPLKCSPRVLFPRISTADGLAEWFADDVTADGDLFTFVWNRVPSTARLTHFRENRAVRFKWADEEIASEDNWFEFRLTSEELSDDVALIISDSCEEEEKDDTVSLWDTEVQRLKTALGL